MSVCRQAMAKKLPPIPFLVPAANTSGRASSSALICVLVSFRTAFHWAVSFSVLVGIDSYPQPSQHPQGSTCAKSECSCRAPRALPAIACNSPGFVQTSAAQFPFAFFSHADIISDVTLPGRSICPVFRSVLPSLPCDP